MITESLLRDPITITSLALAVMSVLNHSCPVASEYTKEKQMRVPRHIATMAIPKENNRKEALGEEKEETVSMSFTPK